MQHRQWFCCLLVQQPCSSSSSSQASASSKRVRLAPVPHIWLCTNPQQVVEQLNRGQAPPEKDAYELTPQLLPCVVASAVVASRRMEAPVLYLPAPPMYVARIDASQLALDQLGTIEFSRSLERVHRPHWSELRVARPIVHQNGSSAITSNGTTSGIKRNGHKSPLIVTAASAVTLTTNEYQLVMVAGPLATRKDSLHFGTLWRQKANDASRSPEQHGAMGMDLARWMQVHLCADLALLLSTSLGEPMRHHALLQSQHGDVWLVDLARQDAMQRLLSVT